jgi:hypothetical protein
MSNPSPLPWSINRFGGLIDATEYRIPVSGTVPARTAEDGATGEANAALIVQAVNSHADLLAACQGPGEDVSPLEWLSALLHEVRDTNWAEMTVDPQAAFTALDESERLLANLRAAIRKAEGDA